MTARTIRVLGTPAPQGSKRHVGRGVLVESSKAVGPWREAVVAACIEQGHSEALMTGPLSVRIDFLLAHPKKHYLSRGLRIDAPFLVATKPDVDKLVRSTLDALTQAGVYLDDCQVAVLAATKHYTTQTPGAWIRVEAATRAPLIAGTGDARD